MRVEIRGCDRNASSIVCLSWSLFTISHTIDSREQYGRECIVRNHSFWNSNDKPIIPNNAYFNFG